MIFISVTSVKNNHIEIKKMATVEFDELVLIADWLTEAPVTCLDIFKGVGLKTVHLVTLSENNFIEAISSGPKPTIEASELWSLVENWRKRNGLVNATIVDVKPVDRSTVSEPVENLDEIHSNNEMEMDFNKCESFEACNSSFKDQENEIVTDTVDKRDLEQPKCSPSLNPLLTPNRLRQLLEQSIYGKQVLQKQSKPKR
ncbi:uncharacterized protein LOC131436827 [Malaya genurostris]|uniref:uncharacterized protein LOC131436827 n=1 Tax=Malaya genurostris TaxID=325434 RepID=UPI0026F3EEDE|nr:uncharacterized protein LOC131436827 [Malaya genurostris]